MLNNPLVPVLSELFSGAIGLVAITGTVLLALHNQPINSTLMVVDGAVIGAFFALKGASGTVAGVRAALQKD